MKNNIRKSTNIFNINDINLLAMGLALLFVLLAPATVLANKDFMTEGVIQGANCVHKKTACPEDRLDAHIALEQDFVLVTADGEHYFLPNLNRAIKARYVTVEVRVSGKKEGHGIWVERLDVNKGNSFKNVWSWEEQQAMYKGGGGD